MKVATAWRWTFCLWDSQRGAEAVNMTVRIPLRRDALNATIAHNQDHYNVEVYRLLNRGFRIVGAE